MDDLIGLSLWAMALGVYLLPTLVARLHEHHQLYGIAALNVLLGWTLLGWIGALVLALKGEEPLNEKKNHHRKKNRHRRRRERSPTTKSLTPIWRVGSPSSLHVRKSRPDMALVR